jgi:hypothetical protein
VAVAHAVERMLGGSGPVDTLKALMEESAKIERRFIG